MNAVEPMPDITKEQAAAALHAIGQDIAERGGSLAREVIDCRETIPHIYELEQHLEWRDRLSLLAYSCRIPTRRKRTAMDVQKMIDSWLPLVKRFSTAHDIDERDAASSALDEYLTPVLGAPVAQIREFYRGLVAAMKADKEVPWAVWKLFEFWGSDVLDKIDKEEIVGLKTEIATRIAKLSVEQVPQEDWINAMIGALQWRAPEKLVSIEEGLKSGQKPRVLGKESCLFMQVGDHEVML